MSKTYSQEELDTIVEGLKNKNNELLKSLNETKSTLKKFDGIDLKELLDSQKTLKALQKKQEEEDGEYKKLYEKSQKDLDEFKSQHETKIAELQSTIDNNTITSELSKELSKHNVLPKLMDSAVKLINDNAKVVDGKVIIGDVSIEDHVKSWAESDVGKHFISNGNTGGGSEGSGNSGESSEAKFYKKGSPTYNLTEQSKIAKANPDLHKKLVSKYANYVHSDK